MSLAFQNFVCGVQPARVIYGEGQTLYLAPETTVEEVLQSHPHHFICQPGLSAFSEQAERGNHMLSLDTELESGCIYFLLPLPKLFPEAVPGSSAPSTCACFSQYNYCNLKIISTKGSSTVSEMKHQLRTSPLKLQVFRSPRRAAGHVSSPSFRSSKPRNLSPSWKLAGSNSRVLPEFNLYSRWNCYNNAADFLQRRRKSTCPWRPRLSCILEEKDLELNALEELNTNGVSPIRLKGCKARTRGGTGAPGLNVRNRPSSISVSASVFGGIGWALPSLVVQ